MEDPGINSAAPIPTPHQEQRDMRIELVRRLMLRGIQSPTEIQQSLAKMDPPVHVTVRSVYRYKSIVVKRSNVEIRKKTGLNKTVEEVAYDIKKSFEEVSRELWKQYHAPVRLRVKCPHPEHVRNNACGQYAEVLLNAAHTKVLALKEIRETASKSLDIMQSLGLVNHAPVKVQTVDKDGNPIDPVAQDSQILNQQFIAFVNATFKDPVGVNKETDLTSQQHEGI